MKTCLCCHMKAAADAPTCANCGEGSWSAVEIVEENPSPVVVESHNTKSDVPATMKLASTWDPDTAVEIPVKRRGGKKPS
jgi:hypothetical protein